MVNREVVKGFTSIIISFLCRMRAMHRSDIRFYYPVPVDNVDTRHLGFSASYWCWNVMMQVASDLNRTKQSFGKPFYSKPLDKLFYKALLIISHV